MAKNKLHKTALKTVVLAIALPNLTHAATDVMLPTINVNAEHESNAYFTPKSSSTKRTESLLNTAKTTQILSAQTLKDQNLLSLQDALATTPGISFGAGEGGGGYGDKITLRGYDASYNTTVDGLRDAALTNRSDLFNYDAVEINKGANSVENGVGQVSGGVNLVSKSPLKRDQNLVTLGKGTDDYTRFTGDFNKVLNDDVAVRLNVMGHQDEYAGRPEERQRWGIAPSITVGLNDNTKATLSYFYQKDDNEPLYGVPYYNGKPVAGVSKKNNYGYRNLDEQNITNNVTTLKIEHEISDAFKLNSITRFSDIEQETVVSAPQGTYCLANGQAPTGYTPTNHTGFTSCKTPSQYIVSGPRGYYRDTHSKQFANDTNVNLKFKTGMIDHTLVAGMGFSAEDYHVKAGGYLYNADGTVATRPSMNVYNPDHNWHGVTNYNDTISADGTLNVYSAYVFDTLKFNDQWLVNLGIRNDYTKGQYASNTRDVVTATNALKNTWTYAKTNQSDNLLSYSAGLTFKPTPATSVYASYANAQKPSQNTANAGCTITTCQLDPETSKSYEVGAKWEANSNLFVTGALFRTEQDKMQINAEQPSGTANTSISLDGKNHVQGVELGVAGNILPNWAVTASAAYMDGELDKNFTTGTGSRLTYFKKGDKLQQVPKFSGSLWTAYDINPQWQVGYGLTYQGKMYLAGSYNGQIAQVQSDDYVIHNASISYKFNKDLTLQLIGKNLSDETYFTHIRNNGWAMPGEGRQAVFNVNYRF